MTRIKKLKPIVLVSFALFVVLVSWSFAQTQYNLIEPLPGTQKVSSFPEYISRLIPFLLAFAALAAFVQIVFGGILRATSGGNPTAIGDANDRIWKAILGLVLAFSAYLILRTINPDLVSLRFLVPEVKISPSEEKVAGQTYESSEICGNNCPGGRSNCKQTPAGKYYCAEFECTNDSDCRQGQKCQTNSKNIRVCASELQICKDTEKSTDCPRGLTCIKFIKYPEPRCTGLPGHLQ